MPGGGEDRRASAPVATVGSAGQVEVARDALAAIGITGDNLALAAIEAVGVIVRLREDWAEQAAAAGVDA